MSLRAVVHDNLDWPTLLRGVTEQGAAFTAHAVRQPVCEQLAGELRDGPYQPVESVIGPVRQETESFEVAIPELDQYPLLSGLCDELIRQVHEHGVPQWMPNEVSIQRYRPGSVGITPHRDQRRYAQLVAVITIAGSAPFTLCRNRDGDPIRTWQARQGSLVLLRGPGLAGDPDGRPMHMVGGPTGTLRTSIGIRMNTTDPHPRQSTR
ncbi:MAG TPA: alpha-ketoglutarate-dependent dioxygenase AlkB [Pseudonocardiaceae bacterium]|nr:alpha-ketoglutarate-dependent dioxygenase AlkB [Pseudonocardiaceae bacterium]